MAPVLPAGTYHCEGPTALRDFEGAFVGCGSFASHRHVRDPVAMSALLCGARWLSCPRATNRGHARPFDLTLDGWHGWISLSPECPTATDTCGIVAPLR